MYIPEAFIGAIKAARKKSEPFKLKELCFSDFYDWKRVCTQMRVVLQNDEENNPYMSKRHTLKKFLGKQ